MHLFPDIGQNIGEYCHHWCHAHGILYMLSIVLKSN